MQDPVRDRIDQAWVAASAWITEWDGGYTLGTFPDVLPSVVAPAIEEVVQRYGLTEIELTPDTDEAQELFKTLTKSLFGIGTGGTLPFGNEWTSNLSE